MRNFSWIVAGLIATAIAAPVNNDDSIQWGSCPDIYTPNILLSQPGVANNSAWLRCANYTVPMDWDNPDGKGTVRLGISKLVARKPKERIGYIFYNPGGPGIPVGPQLAQANFHPEIFDRFDIIGIDLRGSGASSPINCSVDLFNRYAYQPLYATTNASYDKLVNINKDFRQSCLDRSGHLINFMDTVSIAKDYEAVRKALGDENLTWLGQSYGTQLGSQYAELFPHNIRAMVLDGSFSLSQSTTSIFVEAGSSNDACMEHFFDWCEKQNKTACPLAYKDRSPSRIWTDLLARAEAGPIPCNGTGFCGFFSDKNTTSAYTIRAATLSMLYSSGSFDYLASGIEAAAERNDTDAFLPSQAVDGGGPEALFYNSYLFANVIIAALDWSQQATSSPSDMRRKQLLAESEFPLLKGASAEWNYFVRRTLGWPKSDRNPPHRISIPRNSSFPKILMTTNLWDPATPTAMSQQLQEEIGRDRAVLTQTIYAGHTIYFQHDAFEGETVKAINRYLLTRELPEEGTIYHT